MDILSEILAAEQRIRPNILKTPVIESRELSNLINGKVWLKLENEQYTGSFKARGSLNKILSLSEEEKSSGVVTASTGNHALGCARALEIAEVKGTIFLPHNASKAKIKALSNYTAELQFYGEDSLSTELYAKEFARQENRTWVSPYNDPQIIGGQGTIGLELAEQLPEFDYALITVGGGGLISGIATYLKAKRPNTKIISCQPENSPEMALSVKAGKIVGLDQYIETLSDGSAGGIEEGSITFPICQKIVDDYLLVSEEEIAEGLKFAAHQHHKIIEGAAAVTIAALKKNKERFEGAKVVLLLCGANIDIEKLKKII